MSYNPRSSLILFVQPHTSVAHHKWDVMDEQSTEERGNTRQISDDGTALNNLHLIKLDRAGIRAHVDCANI